VVVVVEGTRAATDWPPDSAFASRVYGGDRRRRRGSVACFHPHRPPENQVAHGAGAGINHAASSESVS
jgi:hypothetical protein